MTKSKRVKYKIAIFKYKKLIKLERIYNNVRVIFLITSND